MHSLRRSSLAPSSLFFGHLDVGSMVIGWNWRDASDRWLLVELQLLRTERGRCLTLFEDALGAWVLGVCKGRNLECRGTALIEPGVPDRWADG